MFHAGFSPKRKCSSNKGTSLEEERDGEIKREREKEQEREREKGGTAQRKLYCGYKEGKVELKLHEKRALYCLQGIHFN